MRSGHLISISLDRYRGSSACCAIGPWTAIGLLIGGAVIGNNDNGEAVSGDEVFGGPFKSGQRTA
jgi:hypothetical protein